MDLYQILQEIMDEKGMNIPSVARACGLSDGTVRSIIKRKQKTTALEVAFKLSDGLGVSLERLNGMLEQGEDPNLRFIINTYSNSNQAGKNLLVEQAHLVAESPRYDKRSNVPIAVNEKSPPPDQ